MELGYIMLQTHAAYMVVESEDYQKITATLTIYKDHKKYVKINFKKSVSYVCKCLHDVWNSIVIYEKHTISLGREFYAEGEVVTISLQKLIFRW